MRVTLVFFEGRNVGDSRQIVALWNKLSEKREPFALDILGFGSCSRWGW